MRAWILASLALLTVICTGVMGTVRIRRPAPTTLDAPVPGLYLRWHPDVRLPTQVLEVTAAGTWRRWTQDADTGQQVLDGSGSFEIRGSGIRFNGSEEQLTHGTGMWGAGYATVVWEELLANNEDFTRIGGEEQAAEEAPPLFRTTSVHAYRWRAPGPARQPPGTPTRSRVTEVVAWR